MYFLMKCEKRAPFQSTLSKEITISEKFSYQYYMLVLSKGESFYKNVVIS